MKTDFTNLAADMLADPAFRALCDVEGDRVDDDATPTGKRRTVGEQLALDAIPKTYRSRSKRRWELWTGAATAAAYLKRLPAQAETLHAITDGSFVGADIIPAILALDGNAPARECNITTLSFSNATVYDYAVEELAGRGATVLSARVHAKLILIQTTTGHRFTVETSANLRSCLCVEQLAITRDPGLYQFHRRWIRHVESQTT